MDHLLEGVGTIRRTKDGKEVFQENDRGSEMYVIESGQVRLTRKTIREHRDVITTLAVLDKGDFFGEMALFGGRPRSATATCVGDVVLRAISRRDLEERVREDPKVAFYFLDRLSRRIRKTDELIELLLVREKLAQELYDKVDALRYPEFS